MNPKPLVLDTNVLRDVIASGRNETPDNNSQLDLQVRNSSIDPETVRGALILAMMSRPLVVPHVVLKELEYGKLSKLQGPKNRKNLRLLKESVGQKAVRIVPTRKEILSQHLGLQKILRKAELHVETLRKSGIPIPQDWTQMDLGKTYKEDSPEKRIALTLRKNPYCNLVTKLWRDMGRTTKDVEAISTAADTPQRDLLTHARLQEKLAQDANSSAKEKTDLARKIAEDEVKAENRRPHTVPDIEILMIARRLGGDVFSRDNDFLVLNEEVSTSQEFPKGEIFQRTQGPTKATIQEFLSALDKNLKKHRDSLPQQGPFGLE